VAREIEPEPVVAEIINDVKDRRRMSEGIEACRSRREDFESDLEMDLAGIAMVPEARDMVTERLTEYWAGRAPLARYLRNDVSGNADNREVIVGAGLHAAVYAASRVQLGFPKPIVLERNDRPGGAFAVSMKPVFRLNSRNRPGQVGLPNQDKALNYIPGAPLQPSMITSEEYPDNADMAWLIRLTLAQNADVYTGVTVTSVRSVDGNSVRLQTNDGAIDAARLIDASGMGDPLAESRGDTVLTFQQFMERMGTMFPLRGMSEVAVIGGGDAGKCAVESLLGIAPGNSSAIGLDYVNRVGWYTGGLISTSCSEFREGQRGRYIRIGQFLDGNVSNPTTRLEVFNSNGYATPLPDGVLVNDRTYDMAVVCTGGQTTSLDDDRYSFFDLRVTEQPNATVVGKRATPIEYYKIGPAANIQFSNAEIRAEVADNQANQVAMFRLTPRTAALAAMLGTPSD
jgi:hypothetical protein